MNGLWSALRTISRWHIVMKDVWLRASTPWERPRGWQQLSGLYTHTHLDPWLKELWDALPLPPPNLVKTWKVLINPFLFSSNLYPASFQKECKAAQINLLTLQWQEPGILFFHIRHEGQSILSLPSRQGMTREQMQEGGGTPPSTTELASPPHTRPFPYPLPACCSHVSYSHTMSTLASAIL